MRFSGTILLLIAGAYASTAAARVHDHIFGSGFQLAATDVPANAGEAARFLTQATFGPTQADIAKVMALGYSEWIEEQLGMKPTLARPTVENVVNSRTTGIPPQTVSQSQRTNRWYWQATYAPDQLRQRMAFALSEIFVVSDQSSAVVNDVIPMTEYYDTLTRDAFLLYRTALEDVTYAPTMGKYLSHFRNQKPSATTSPDENYAREVMQLFSIGLIERNLDFSPILNAGVEIPTYDQAVIGQTAKVFTGFTYSDAPISPPNFYAIPATDAGAYNPMKCWGEELFPNPTDKNMRHDITGVDGTTATKKLVVNGGQIAPNQTCHADVADELDIVASHPNVAPFIARQLIQRFVTSNPSAPYIQRIAQKFLNNGVGDRGDMGDVIKAILLDPEARTPPVLASGDSYGKLREPLLRLTAMWRAWNAQPQPADQYGEVAMNGGTNFVNSYGQGPLESPTVFNFFAPDYQQPGSALYAPEFQIVNEATTYSTGNSFYSFTAGAYVGMSGTVPTNRPLIKLAPLAALASQPAQMTAMINNTMLYGSMSANMQGAMISMLTNLNGTSANEKAWSAIYITMLSPEYAIQR